MDPLKKDHIIMTDAVARETLKTRGLVDQIRDELNRIDDIWSNQASTEATKDCRDYLNQLVICLDDVGPDRASDND